jgi:primosomal protein N' (replication factor Y) (superfamily II helicase)
MPASGASVSTVISVAVFAPLRQVYDYLEPADDAVPAALPGMRVWIPFGHGHRVGVVVARRLVPDVDIAALKAISAVLDTAPIIDQRMLALATWAASYYHHPLGDVVAALLPTRLRRRLPLPDITRTAWRLTAAGADALAQLNATAARQRKLLTQLAIEPTDEAGFGTNDFPWRPVLRRLESKAWVERCTVEATAQTVPIAPGVVLNAEQARAADAITARLGAYQALVLYGVTGSGKTEVYLEAIARCLTRGGQALVLVPEIALTQQLVQRFRSRFDKRVALLHSGLTDSERVRAWDASRNGRAEVLIGTRSAVWAGLPRLGLIIVDEEHDPSYKQQDGFRYSARDVAIMRAQQAGIPVVLGSATPSLETLANIERGKFTCLRLETRALAQSLPNIECLDVRGLELKGGLSDALQRAMHEHLARGEQVMLFLNRRGYAPLLICRTCGEMRRCDRCDAFLVYHKAADAARCHHCDKYVPMRRPASCCDAADIAPVGLGTEQVEELVAELFPERRICRMDRDTVRHPNAMTAMLDDIAAGRVDILIGTQMVAKGLDFAAVTLVGVVDADSRLYALDFRAEERLAQLLIQVAGRAGRAARPGRVLIQTHQPHHPVLRRIIDEGYAAYAASALAERQEAGLPPYAAMAIVRAEATFAARPLEFLAAVRSELMANGPPIETSYPIPALMERRAGRYRALIVISAPSRTTIGQVISLHLQAIETLARRQRVRFSIDIDPQDTL